MNGMFWMGLLVGFLLGVITTVIAVFLFFVPIRSATTPAPEPAAVIEHRGEVLVDFGGVSV